MFSGVIFLLHLGWNITRGNLFPPCLASALLEYRLQREIIARMSTACHFQFPKKSLIILGDLNLAWTLWTLSIKLQGSFYFSKESACVWAKIIAIFLAVFLLSYHCVFWCKIEMRSYVSSRGCLFLGWHSLWAILYQTCLVYIIVNNFVLVASTLFCVHPNCSSSSREPLFKYLLPQFFDVFWPSQSDCISHDVL